MSPNAVVCISDPRLRSLFSLLLTDVGALVVAGSDADEVLRVAAGRFCQLCVMTHGSVPDMEQFIAALKRASPDTRLLLIAEREAVDAIIPLFWLGLNDVLLQPINPKRAVVALQRLMGPAKNAGASGEGAGGGDSSGNYRPAHVTARSAAMRRMISELLSARNDPVGVILRGEAGVEFELVAREYQAMSGDPSGYLVVLNAQDLDVDTLATQISLDRLNEGPPRTYYVPEVEKLSREQAKPLLEFLRRARRMRDREKPLRIVFASQEFDGTGRSMDSEFMEELQFIIPAVVRVPALRERREDVELIVRRVIMELTAIMPDKRVRSVHPSASQWLSGRNWRGNHDELVAAVRQAVMDCPNRELSPVHFGKLTEVPAVVAVPDAEERAAARVLAAASKAVRG
jgi:DNA-binding NtrC family response regulator